jgi:putative glutamine amidotransferase
MSARPVLGIICCTRHVGAGRESAQAVINRYVIGAQRYADANGLLVPALPDLLDAPVLADRLDGILLTGSPSNVEPGRYGDADPDAAGPFDPARDEMVLRLVEAMRARAKPLLGICRGFQELNVAFGGSLRRDMATHPELTPHHAPDGVPFEAMFDHVHPVRFNRDGILAKRLGTDEAQVNSVHFQGVDRLGADLTVQARAPDGVVEAFSGTADSPVFAVQWHPEWKPEGNAQAQQVFGIMGDILRGSREGL